MDAALSPLDQLEAQINLVLEHTGRIFANSARSGSHGGTVNHPARLKQIISGAESDFHDALDELEAELALARAVMRRDLAVYRATQGKTTTRPNNESVVETANGTGNRQNADTNLRTINIDDDDDIIMEENSPATTPKAASLTSPSKVEQLEASDAIGTPSIQVKAHEPPEIDQQVGNAQRSPIKIEIPVGAHSAVDGSATDTATGTYSNFDFESLFNDPAATAPNSATSPTAPESAREPTTGNEEIKAPTDVATGDTNGHGFDFTDMNGFGGDGDNMHDTDNISSLLPGLESYANAGSGSTNKTDETDSGNTFNIFSAAGGPDFGSGADSAAAVTAPSSTAAAASSGADAGTSDQPNNATRQQGGQRRPSEQHRDTTFDDLMEFDNFDQFDFGTGEAEGGHNAFDADFFNI